MRGPRLCPRWICGTLALWLALAGPGWAQGRPPEKRDWSGVVKRCESAEAQLALARRRKMRRLSVDPRERESATRDAIEAYRAVRAYFPRERALGAEAAYRAGQLLAATGDTRGARAEYEVAERLGGHTDFRPRARLALARLLALSGERDGALRRYHEVAIDAEASARRRGQAWLAEGDLLAQAGEQRAALRAWRTVTSTPSELHERIDAYDRIGMSYVERGDLEAAAGVLAECRDACAEVALLQTETGARARRLLASMKLPALLARAIAERTRDKSRKRTP